ncbi:CK1/CK1/CK1-D protein kinase [Capronia epimyces CBS 606.96]|uniref:non-specific serine/threonine protein kinase n=1 Tax=Capronia epimyces CBS 606.96 TaxID=1182542 RepID=W9XVC8_9EURO|nr:CK1/CK1/CK1-D protein kinase [Capronia epimyces CBS 606.96]EXJ80936.1 CK1/CK1/CK1-D protein kinase [Capronia epimyces CBS 606.96]
MDPFVQRVREIRIGGKYQLLRKLGSGSFGKVYLGRDVDSGAEVAIKLEHFSADPSLLDDEVPIYQELAGQTGFPRIFWHGFVHDFKALVFELLGPNLEDLIRYCGNHFSLKTTLMLTDQLLRRFEVLHSHRYLHRDVKPENFLLGVGRQGNVVYMTDLGLATYLRPRSPGSNKGKAHEHSTYEPHLLGTCRYASINGHLGAAQSPWDDLEALGYMLVYFLKGKLPWQGLRGEGKYRRVLEMKQTIPVDELCADLPPEFASYMHHVRHPNEDDLPDYRYLRKLFSNLFHREGFENDNVFDWTIREFIRLEAESQPTSPMSGVVEERS